MMANNEPNIQIKARLFAGSHMCGSVLSLAYGWLCYLPTENVGRRRRYANANANSHRLANSNPCCHWQAVCYGCQFGRPFAF